MCIKLLNFCIANIYQRNLEFIYSYKILQKILLFPNNRRMHIQDNNNISDFFPLTINDPKENILEDNDDGDYLILLNEEIEYIYDLNIEGSNKNNTINTKKNILINHSQEENRELVKKEFCNTSEELIKLEDEKLNIFEIIKDKKNIQKKRKRNRTKLYRIKKNKDDKYFPFKAPKGLISLFDIKFYTKQYSVKENGKIRKIPKGRKFKSDDIRKKIKSRFHKELKNILNKHLKKCGSEKMFDSLPQSFISNVSKISNSKYLNLTYKELLLIDFRQTIYKDDCSINKIANKKFLKNKEILDYLELNPEISKLSGFSAIKDLKYKELLEKYFNSSQFEKSILKLKNEKESAEYIIKYIRHAKEYVDYYTNDKFEKNEKGPINIEINKEKEE